MSTDTKQKMDTTPGKRIPGNHKGVEQEVREILLRRFNKGIFHVHFGAGQFKNHMIPSIMEPVSFCGRFVGDTSTSMLPTPIGKVCRGCINIHKKTFVEWLNKRAETLRDDEIEKLTSLGNLRKMMWDNPTTWHAEFVGYRK